MTTPPYDTITAEERRAFLDASPYNVIRLDLCEEEPGEDRNKYTGAARTLEAWRSDGALVSTDRPTYFAYEMRFSLADRERRVRGLVCAVTLEPWGGSILPHERTMAGPLEDRLQLLRATRANLSCVYGVFAGPNPVVAEVLNAATEGPPPVRVVDDAGVAHQLWTVEPDARVAEALREETLLIADGHHRYTTALRFRDETHASHGPGPWDQVMMLVVDAAEEQPPVLPYHRIVGFGSVPETDSTVADLGEVLDSLSDERLVYGMATRTGGGVRYGLGTLRGEPPAVRALHQELLDARVPEEGLRFTQKADKAERAVIDGEAVAAFFLPPTTAERIRQIAERDERLPQKSTFFWPKPLTGMVIRLLG